MKKTIIFLAIITLIGGYLYWQNDYAVLNKEDTTHTNPITEADQEQNDATNEEIAKDESSNKNTDEETEPSEEPQKQTKREANPIISNISKDSEGNVTVRTVLNEAKNGTCTLTFSKGNHKVVKTAPVGLITDYYVCQGFRDIPRGDFPEGGVWSVVLEVESNEVYGKSDTREVTL